MTDSRPSKKCCTRDPTQAKLKVLCLHGYRQNGEAFKQKTGSLRKMLHKWVQFTYITAPHKVYLVHDLSNVDEIDLQDSVDADQYGWFFNRDDRSYRGIRKGGPAIGFEESIQVVEYAFKEHGPFDGIVSFSQGGCFLGLLCSLQQRNMLPFQFNFAVFFSAFKSGCLPHLKYYGGEINLPSLHVFGESDNIIPTEMSVALRDAFEDPVTVIHSGGHYVPASAEQKCEYQKFFEQRFIEKQERVDEDTELNL